MICVFIKLNIQVNLKSINVIPATQDNIMRVHLKNNK